MMRAASGCDHFATLQHPSQKPAMPTSDRRRRTVPVSVPTVPPPDGQPPEADGSPVCGWFDSSWALSEGLAVQELDTSDLPDPDGTLAAR